MNNGSYKGSVKKLSNFSSFKRYDHGLFLLQLKCKEIMYSFQHSVGMMMALKMEVERNDVFFQLSTDDNCFSNWKCKEIMYFLQLSVEMTASLPYKSSVEKSCILFNFQQRWPWLLALALGSQGGSPGHCGDADNQRCSDQCHKPWRWHSDSSGSCSWTQGHCQSCKSYAVFIVIVLDYFFIHYFLAWDCIVRQLPFDIHKLNFSLLSFSFFGYGFIICDIKKYGTNKKLKEVVIRDQACFKKLRKTKEN